jgi:acetolactate synthase I/II/III large subunit
MNKIKLTDALTKYLENKEIKNIFSVVGGANLHIIDSLSKSNKLNLFFNHHEQASALAAQASARISKKPGVCVVTTGPGGTNAITGVLSAWQDSIPCIFISGQSRSNILKDTKNLRQVGAQGLDIIKLVKPITKKAISITNPKKFLNILDELYELSLSDRPGPVWIDIPFDIQIEQIENFIKKHSPLKISGIDPSFIKKFKLLLNSAKKPIIIAGNGIHTSNTENEYLKFIKKLKIPNLLTWNASDLLEFKHKYNLGRPGMFGQRAANIIIQNCDLIIALGTHLNLAITTPNIKEFSKNSKLIIINIDQEEIKNIKKKPNLSLNIDLKKFFKVINKVKKIKNTNTEKWLQHCNIIKKKINKDHTIKYTNKIDPYTFVKELSVASKHKHVIVVDGGGTCNQIFFQTFENKKNQRMVISAGICAMGSGIPDSIGVASNNKEVILICGDGSFQPNIQELQTIKDNNFNIKIFIFSNNAYLSIRHTQKEFLDKNYIGSIKSGGLNVPNLKNIAKSYEINYKRFANISNFKKKINNLLKVKGPLIFEISMPKDYEIMPRMGFIKQKAGNFVSAGLENMYPFLDEKEKKIINNFR